MTKKIRIEDADQSKYQVVVKVMQRGPKREIENADGSKSFVHEGPDTIQSEVRLFGPTDLRDFSIHDGQYLIVEEDGERKGAA